MKHSRFARRTLVQAIAGLILFLMFFRWFEHSQVYHPTRSLDPAEKESAQPIQDVFFKASDGVQLNAWFFPAALNAPRRDLALVLCHGNGGNISHRVDLCLLLRELGINVLSFDYRGYGLSEGRPSEEGTYKDAQAAHAWLVQNGFPHQRIIAYGESLGGGVASELAAREPVAGLVLHSTFTSIPDIGSELFPWLPVRLLCRIRYNTLDRLPRIKVPVLVLHSRTDEMIGFAHGERNFAAANEPKQFAEIHGGHNDPLGADRDTFVRAIESFLTFLPQATP
ncbi:MAG TPA: alpha/beta hydrolase [Verrucomicrobiae bacterium]|nr:alpha/beta hydrolase [Verrucomicrobiae bacterium]